MNHEPKAQFKEQQQTHQVLQLQVATLQEILAILASSACHAPCSHHAAEEPAQASRAMNFHLKKCPGQQHRPSTVSGKHNPPPMIPRAHVGVSFLWGPPEK